MTAKQIVLFLAGDRDSILKIAGCRHAVWLGLLFVLSAGFAREYDGEDLLHEPWHLLIPLVASLVTSFLLFAHVWSWSGSRSSRELGFLRGYRSFLGLYWMTAPLAWLYAIPVERFHSAADATRLNLALLGLVSVWRVILMMRIVSVLFERRFRVVIFPVMLFADTVAIILLFLTPLPIISLMGGIRLTESEQLLQNTAFMIGFWGGMSWLIWLLGTAVTLGRPEKDWQPKSLIQTDLPVSRLTWGLAVAALVVWLPILPYTQPEQQLRRTVEQDLRNGRIRQAIATMSAHEPSDFPPHWDPPPRIGYGEHEPDLFDLELLEALVAEETKPWVRAAFIEKMEFQWKRDFTRVGPIWVDLDNDELDRLLTVLEKLPKDTRAIIAPRSQLQELVDISSRTELQKERIRRLIGKPNPKVGPPADLPPY